MDDDKTNRRNVYKNDWSKANRDRVSLMIPKDGDTTKAKIQAAASADGVSLNAWIMAAIRAKLEQEQPEQIGTRAEP